MMDDSTRPKLMIPADNFHKRIKREIPARNIIPFAFIRAPSRFD
jgi:hypothetical protein